MLSEPNNNNNIRILNSEQKQFESNYKPTPSDREVLWDKSKVLICKTDSKGIILYANEAFIDVCGYDDFELITKNNNIVRHPDMPKVMFKVMWESILDGNNFVTIIKNMSKTGRYYWINSEINCTLDKNGDYTYTSRQKAVNNESIIKRINNLYKKLLHIEQASGVVASENYLIGFLEERGQSFSEYINTVLSTENNDEDTNKENHIEPKYEINTAKTIDVTEAELERVKKKGFFTSFFAKEDEKE